MKRFKLWAPVMATLLAGCGANLNKHQAEAWPERASSLIAEGEFTRAGNVLDSVKRAGGLTEADTWKIDSLGEMMRRIRIEFPLDEKTVDSLVRARIAGADETDIQAWEDSRLLEMRRIDGEKRYFRRAVNNLILIAPDLERVRDSLGYEDDTREDFTVVNTAEIIRDTRKPGEPVQPIEMTVNYTLTVKPNAIPAGDTLRCWLPFPQEMSRQKGVELLSTFPAEHVLADNGLPHRSVYLEQVARADSATVFRAKFKYTAYSQYYPQAWLEKNVQPYDTASEVYKTYTAQRKPHILYTGANKSIAEKARELVGAETNPVKKASLIFNWVNDNFPWASAVEYGVIPDIPHYVTTIGHGDCGQVSLLLITMLRSQGIPAKWQSGWMLHPGDVNLHDWAEIYYEGVGWVPADMSFGLQPSEDPAVHNFFKSGMDSYRMVVNQDYGRPFTPAKKFLRSEPVDFQRGEVEWKGGNLYFPEWSYELDVERKKL